jgi:hypothetical protein
MNSAKDTIVMNSDFARPPRLSEQARDGGQGMRILELDLWNCFAPSKSGDELSRMG